MTTPTTPEDTITAWIAREFGGTIVTLERQSRWRPAWFADVERDGQIHSLMIRGERTDTPLILPLRHEMDFQQLLYDAGIPIPEVHGWIDELPAYVSTRVPGRPDFEESTDAERATIMAEYMATLANIHRLDIAPFAAAGIVRADVPARAGLIGVEHFERAYRHTKKRPDPFSEFALGWLKRNPLPARDAESPIVWDSGQFHHIGGHLNAVLDVEIGHLGDPMMDLAGFRMRDTVLHFGSFTQLYETYEAAGGFPVDIQAIQWHHLFFTLTNQLSFGGALADPTPGSDYMTNLQWCSETNLHATEAFAEMLGYDLPTVDIPDAVHTNASVGHHHLVRTLRELQTDDDYTRYRIRGAFRLARHLQRHDEIGAAVLEANLDDLTPLLGHRPRTEFDADTALENYVATDDGQHDEQLVQLFHRRHTRLRATTGPAGSAMAEHHVVQPFA
jgi:aminoglycoside phosphotransferase (APT) family kinase protein